MDLKYYTLQIEFVGFGKKKKKKSCKMGGLAWGVRLCRKENAYGFSCIDCGDE